MKTSFIKSILLWMCTALLVISFLACNTNNDTYWFEDPPGVFHTNDVERAQNEIPFIILLPTYLPDDIDPFPYIEGPVGGINSENIITQIRVQYHDKSRANYRIFIDESNEEVTMLPNPDAEYAYFSVNGVRLLEHESVSVSFSQDGIENIRGLLYSWNQNGIHYEVCINRYNSGIARRIVESMVT